MNECVLMTFDISVGSKSYRKDPCLLGGYLHVIGHKCRNPKDQAQDETTPLVE